MSRTQPYWKISKNNTRFKNKNSMHSPYAVIPTIFFCMKSSKSVCQSLWTYLTKRNKSFNLFFYRRTQRGFSSSPCLLLFTNVWRVRSRINSCNRVGFLPPHHDKLFSIFKPPKSDCSWFIPKVTEKIEIHFKNKHLLLKFFFIEVKNVTLNMFPIIEEIC